MKITLKHKGGSDTMYLNDIEVPPEVYYWMVEYGQEICKNCKPLKVEPEVAIEICAGLNNCGLDVTGYIEARRNRLYR